MSTKIKQVMLENAPFEDSRISESSVTQHVSAIDHNSLLNFVPNKHIDWTLSSAGTIHQTNIPEIAITQYEGALTITESQISDLGNYLTVEINDLTAAVVWDNVPDENITQSSVIQHQSALAITESQISDLGNYLVAADIDTLAELNAILSDATLIDTTDSRLSDARTPTAHTHTESDITDLGAYIENIHEDITPELGANLSLAGYSLTDGTNPIISYTGSIIGGSLKMLIGDTSLGSNSVRIEVDDGNELIQLFTDTASLSLTPTDLTLYQSNMLLSGAGKMQIGNAASESSIGKLYVQGSSNNVLGPHACFVGNTDSLPMMGIYPWNHDNITLAFDCYFDGTNFKSGDAGSNYAIRKLSDKLGFWVDSGEVATNNLTLELAFSVDTSRNVTFESSILVDTISEKTAAAGVTIDGLLVKDGGIPVGAVTAHVASIDHDSLLNFVANEHIDWTSDQGATNIHPNNIDSLVEGVVTAHEAALSIAGTQLTGTISVSRFDSGSNANASTYLNGNGQWTTPATSDGSLEKVTVSTSRDIAGTDLGKILRVDTTSGPVTLTIPSGLSDYFLFYVQRSAGTNNIIISGGSGVTVNGTATISETKDPVTIWQSSADNFDIWNNSPVLLTPREVTGTSAIVTLSDNDNIIEMNNASANTVTVQVDATLDLPIGFQCSIVQIGAGTTTIVADTGVTIHSKNGLVLSDQYAPATLYKRAANEWVLFGDLTT